MKNIIYICIALFLFVSCTGEDSWDCVQAVGDTVTQEVIVQPFDKITVEDDIILTIEQGSDYRVTITTGDALLNDILVQNEEDGVLRLKNYNKCNVLRSYDNVSIHVVTPTLTRVRSASRNSVSSVGTLSFPRLLLRSNTGVGVIDPGKSGDFIMDVDAELIVADANGQSEFIITGQTEQLTVSFLDEIPKFSGEDLTAQNVTLFARSANKITINPQQSIKGQLLSTGNVYSLNQPAEVDVTEAYTGRLIFID